MPPHVGRKQTNYVRTDLPVEAASLVQNNDVVLWPDCGSQNPEHGHWFHAPFNVSSVGGMSISAQLVRHDTEAARRAGVAVPRSPP